MQDIKLKTTKGEMKMKNIIIIMIVMTFIFALGSAYAGELSNGITDFTGRTYDTLEPAAASSEWIVSSGAGGLVTVEPGKELYNGITDFTGKTDNLEPAAMNSRFVESSGAGGMRSEEPGKELNNGITDFTGGCY
jgi:hypothetical protein